MYVLYERLLLASIDIISYFISKLLHDDRGTYIQQYHTMYLEEEPCKAKLVKALLGYLFSWEIGWLIKNYPSCEFSYTYQL